MRIGERRIASQVREREEARARYAAARDLGQKASLVEQARPNLFTTSVANVNPGETVVVKVELLDEVDYLDGTFRTAFPLTLTPRYGPATGPGPATGAATAAPPLVSIRAAIDAGFPLAAVRSTSHEIRVAPDGRRAIVRPEGGPVPADRDLVLAWTPDRPEGPGATAFLEDRPDGRYALLTVLPPASGDEDPGLPTETMFVVDVSGSMDGPSIAAARDALAAALDRLHPGDVFHLMKFADSYETFRDEPQPAYGVSLEQAREWVRALEASGGTELVPALVRALDLVAQGDSSRARRIVLVTDAAVSNEDEALREVAPRLGATRLHVVGIGAAPNRFLLRKLARLGRGTTEFVARASEAEERIDALLQRIERPILGDLTLAWTGDEPDEVFPQAIPDLYSGEPLRLSARFGPGKLPARVVLSGRAGDGAFRQEVEIRPDGPAESGVAVRWARAKVESLVDGLREGADPEAVRRDVVALAVAFSLATRYTSLIAVEEARSAAEPGRPVHVVSGTAGGTSGGDGSLPEGGTLNPLVLRAGLFLSLAGAALAWSARRMRS